MMIYDQVFGIFYYTDARRKKSVFTVLFARTKKTEKPITHFSFSKVTYFLWYIDFRMNLM